MTSGLTRLKHRSEYLRVADRGRRHATPGVVLQVWCREQDGAGVEGVGAIRYGITASRRVGNAVARNRVRRRLRALAEQVLPLYGRRGCDYVLIGRAATIGRSFPSLVGDLTTALRRLRVLSRSAVGCRKGTAVPDVRSHHRTDDRQSRCRQ